MQVYIPFARPANQDRRYFPYDPTKAKPMGTGLVNPSEEHRESKRKLDQENREKLERALTARMSPEMARIYLDLHRKGII